MVGERLPRRDDILTDPSTQWHTATVNWYAEGERQIEWCSGTGWWNRFRAGRSPLPLRWVISRDPRGERETRFYFATDQTLSGLDIVLAFMARWSAEVTFEESRAHLGIQTRAAVVRYGYRTQHPLFAGPVQPGDSLGVAALSQRGHSHAAHRLVSQVAGDLLRCPCGTPFLFMESIPFSDFT